MLRSLTSLPCQNFKIGRVCPGRTPPTNIYDVNSEETRENPFFRAQENENVCSPSIKASYMERLNDGRSYALTNHGKYDPPEIDKAIAIN